jgi:hypothetical protein
MARRICAETALRQSRLAPSFVREHSGFDSAGLQHASGLRCTLQRTQMHTSQHQVRRRRSAEAARVQRAAAVKRESRLQSHGMAAQQLHGGAK